MAKKKTEKKGFSFSKVGGLLDNITKKVPVIIESEIKDRKFIDTGVYLLNAALSAKMLDGGIEYGKIFTVAGDSGTGKTFIALSVVKNAQKSGMGVIYIDTEYSLRLDDLPKYGVDNDPDKFKLIRGNKVEDINILLTQLLDELKSEKLKNGDIEPFLIVLDSVGQMSSNKEKTDLISGNLKVDMTRAKSLAALFRSINTDLGYLNIPMVVCNHVYLEQGSMYPRQIIKGGKALVYSSSVIGMMSKAKLKSGDEDDMDLGASGIVVTFKTAKNRLAKPKKIKFEISFVSGMNVYTGLDAFCRPEFYDKIGIAKGKEVVDKETGEITFQPGGNRWYIRHLGKSVYTKNLLTSEVFTPEVLKLMEPIVNDYFRYKTIDEIEDMAKEFDNSVKEDDTDGFEDMDNVDASDLFD
jgi:RecA/RadA recombinase|tara:strand:- start:5743 stop:6972 length:1230 start_codon:yes stop_codon:yes gene_type:complete